jgi:hypothetical protein
VSLSLHLDLLRVFVLAVYRDHQWVTASCLLVPAVSFVGLVICILG